MSTIHPVILCGGSGTRLWPKSRKSLPKPFLPLVGDRTLFEETVSRCAGEGFAAPAIVCGADHLSHVEAQLGGAAASIIVEPEGKNTAAAIALVAHRLPRDAVMLVCPSDHHIADVDAFRDAARTAAKLAREGHLVAFGIKPTEPETGYGYLKRGAAIDGGYALDRFVEKPDRDRAEAFLSDGGYSWNGGIFVFSAGQFLEELAAHRPALAQHVEAAVSQGMDDGARFHPEAGAFGRIDGESFDYAVMENTSRAAMVPVDMGWSDIGNWQALKDARGGDERNNVVRGSAQLVDCRDVQVDSDGPRVSAIGLEGVTIVVDKGEVLVIGPGGEQRVGDLDGAQNQD